MSVRPYTLLTGATGLLGRFLMRDLLRKGCPLAVLVRPSRELSPAERVERALNMGTPRAHGLRQPVVLEGDLDGMTGELKIGASARQWVRNQVDSVVHCAASVTFEHSARTGEPYRTNVEGTRALIDFCRLNQVSRLHHVSTAYVCGDRPGTVLETDLDLQQRPRNAYEQSKRDAELLIQSAKSDFEGVTTYRPSIIVGEYSSGFATTFHGFYVPLKILKTLAENTQWSEGAHHFWSALGMEPDDSKNLVSVDWVSTVMARIITDPTLHGRTYHVTNKHPVSVALIGEVFSEAIGLKAATPPSTRISAVIDAFVAQMQPYRAYLDNDPVFDTTHLEAAIPDLPAPRLSRAALMRLARFALAAADEKSTLSGRLSSAVIRPWP
jgi:thioester reductase-like protein